MTGSVLDTLVEVLMESPMMLSKMRAEHEPDASGRCRVCRHGGDGSGRTRDCISWLAVREAASRLRAALAAEEVPMAPDGADVAQAIADQLTRHGDTWSQHLPPGAVIVALGSRVVFDSVRLADDTLIYRRQHSYDTTEPVDRWLVVGWSDASKARRYRPIPDDLLPWSFDDHDDT